MWKRQASNDTVSTKYHVIPLQKHPSILILDLVKYIVIILSNILCQKNILKKQW